jgi:hypothetical protein
LACAHEDIRGLDVAVHDPLGMRGVERIGHLDADLQQPLHVHRAAADAMFERGAVHEFHGDEGMAGILADLINRADVGVIQGRGGAGLAAETFERNGIARQFCRKKF